MLVKTITPKGDAVAFQPEELLVPAINYGVRIMNTHDKVFYLREETVVQTGGNITQHGDTWEALAEGVVNIGFVDAKTGMMHKARPHNYSIHYKPGKDSIGLPDIVLTAFTATEIPR